MIHALRAQRGCGVNWGVVEEQELPPPAGQSFSVSLLKLELRESRLCRSRSAAETHNHLPPANEHVLPTRGEGEYGVATPSAAGTLADPSRIACMRAICFHNNTQFSMHVGTWW